MKTAGFESDTGFSNRKPDTLFNLEGSGDSEGMQTPVKSSLSACYHDRADIQTLWMTLSRLENYTGRFWQRFLELLALWENGPAGALKHMDFPETLQKFHQFLRIYSRSASGVRGIVLTFEEWDLLESGAIREFIENLIVADLPNTTVILVSERTISVNLPGDTKGGRAVRIYNSQYRFSMEQMRMWYLAQGLDLTGKQIRELHHRTGGWVFAVYLCGIEMRKSGYPDDTGFNGLMRPVFQVLERDMFRKYPEELRKALQLLAPMDRFSPGLAASASGVPREKLTGLLDRDPLVEYDPFADSYRCSDIYRHFLSSGYLSPPEKEESNAFYSRAGRWYEEHGQYREAVYCYSACLDYDRVYRTILSISAFHVTVTDARRLWEILNRLPEEFTLRYPVVRVKKISLFFSATGDHALLERMLQELREELEAEPVAGELRNALGEVYVIQGVMKMLRGEKDFAILLRMADALLPGGSVIITRSVQFLGNRNALLYAGPGQSMEEMHRLLFEVAPCMQRVLNGSGAGMEYLAAAEAAYYTGYLHAAEQQVYQAIERGRIMEQTDVVCSGYYLLMRIGFARGKYEEVTDNLERLERYAREADTGAFQPIPDVASGWLYLKMEQCHQVADWILDEDVNRRTVSRLNVGRDRVIRAGCLLATGKHGELLSWLDESIRMCSEWNQFFIMLKLRIIKAIVMDRIGDMETAVRELRTAWQLAENDRLTMPFIELGKLMRSLVVHVQNTEDHGISEDWLQMVERKSATYAKYAGWIRNRYDEEHEPDDFQSLTSREQDILQALCQGLTRAEIADGLGLSVNTVKAGLRDIYTKLNAANRSDAVRMATRDPRFRKKMPDSRSFRAAL